MKKTVNAELPGYEYAILNELQQMMYVAAFFMAGLQVDLRRDGKLGCCAIRDVTGTITPLW